MSANSLEHGVNAHAQDTRDVTNARTMHHHWHDQLTHVRHAAVIAISSDELTEAVAAAILLFSVSSCAILFDVPRGTSRAGDFFVAHTLKNSLSESLFQHSIFSES